MPAPQMAAHKLCTLHTFWYQMPTTSNDLSYHTIFNYHLLRSTRYLVGLEDCRDQATSLGKTVKHLVYFKNARIFLSVAIRSSMMPETCCLFTVFRIWWKLSVGSSFSLMNRLASNLSRKKKNDTNVKKKRTTYSEYVF
jgi:hypothetical protein